MINFLEIIDLIIIVAVVGFIFKDFFKIQKTSAEGLPILQRWFNWESFKIAIYVTAPAIILHELAHKFIAISFGYNAVLHAAYLFLAIGVIIRLIRLPFIFFVPAFVEVSAPGGVMSLAQSNPVAAASIAIAGPLVNLILWLGSKLFLKYKTDLKQRTKIILLVTAKLNMFLFFLNMIPFVPFDGGHFFRALFQIF